MQSLALADETKNVFQQAIEAAIPIGPYQLHWLELIAVLIGVASAWFGMKRRGSGPGPSASSPTSCSSSCTSARSSAPTSGSHSSARPAGRSSSSSPASTAGGGGRRCADSTTPTTSTGAAITPRWATATRAHGGRRLLARRHRRRAPGVRVAVEPRAEPVLHAAVVVLLVRRVDLRRLDRRHVRHGPRLERVLARLDRGRPRRQSRSASRPGYVPTAVLYTFYGLFVDLRLHPVGQGVADRAARRRGQRSRGRRRADHG